MNGEYISDGDLLVRKESIVAVRRSAQLQGLTVWIGVMAPTSIELVYASQTERDQAFQWLSETLT